MSENDMKIVHKTLTKKPIVKLDEQYVLSYEKDILKIDEIIPLYKLNYYIEEYAPELIRKKTKVTIESKPLNEILKYRVDNKDEIDEFIDIHNTLGIPLKKEKLDSFIFADKKTKAKTATQFHALEDSIFGKELFHTFEKKLNSTTEHNYKFKLVIETPIKSFTPTTSEFIEVDIKAEINLIDYPLRFYIPIDIQFKDENDLEKLIYYTLGYIQNKVSDEKNDLLNFRFKIQSIEKIHINELQEDNNTTFVLLLSDIDNNLVTPFITLHKVFIDDNFDPINKLKNMLTKVANDSIKQMDNFYDKLIKRSSSYTYGFEINVLKNYTYIKGEKKQLYDATAIFKDKNGSEYNLTVEYSINSRYPNKMLPVYLDIDTIDTNNRIEKEVLEKVHTSFNKVFKTDTSMEIEVSANMKEYLRCLPFSKDDAVICYKIAAINVSVEVFSILIYFSIDELSNLLNDK